MIDKFYLQQKPSFVDYLRSGWSINMALAIDFTASNGEPSDPNSLHKIYNQFIPVSGEA